MHTAQAGVAGNMDSSGQHYTGDITVTATTVYTRLLLKSSPSVEDNIIFTTKPTNWKLFIPETAFS